MRRIVMFNHVSADGQFAGPDGNLDWVQHDPEIDSFAEENMPGGDTLLLGRRTYEMFASYWPHALDESAGSQGPHGEELSPEHRAMAIWLNDATKIVFSKTLKEVTWKNSQLVHELDAREIEKLKSQPGKDMLVMGSGSIVSQLTEYGLIDEYLMAVNPIFLANGLPLLTGLSTSAKLQLLEARPYRSGNVMLRYAHSQE